jgi:CDP-diglyceride synthetase
MKTRILTAAVALPLIAAAIILPAYYHEAIWLFVGIAAIALAAGLFEFYSITKKQELKADAAIGYLGAIALFIGFVFDAPANSPDLMFVTLALFVIVLLVTQMFRFRADFTRMLTGTAVTLLGVLYLAFLGGYLVATRTGFDTLPGVSTHLLGYFFLVMFGSDTGAYFTGRAFG